MGIWDLLGEIPTNAVLRNKVASLEGQLDAITKEKVKADEKLTEALAKIAEMEGQLRAQAGAATKDMEEESGAKFKRRPGGGYYETVFCPRCLISVAARGPYGDFECTCGWQADFRKHQLAVVMKRLPQNDAGISEGPDLPV